MFLLASQPYSSVLMLSGMPWSTLLPIFLLGVVVGILRLRATDRAN